MSPQSTDLKTRLVLAASAALGLSVGCSASDEAEPATTEATPTTAAETSGTEELAPAEPMEERTRALQRDQAAPESLNVAEDADELDSEEESDGTPPARTRRRRSNPGPACPPLPLPSNAGPAQTAPEPSQEVVCGASCGADCGGVPGDDEEED